jgi:hypothetical protein
MSRISAQTVSARSYRTIASANAGAIWSTWAPPMPTSRATAAQYHVAPAPSGAHARVDHQLATILRPLAIQAGLDGATACNIGTPTDYRVPDQAYFRSGGLDDWNPTAAMVVEVASPGDDSRRKPDFYFRAGVEEILIVDPAARTAEWFARGPDGFRPAAGSRLLGITSIDLAEAIDWPVP